jgi:hypothetical protein
LSEKNSSILLAKPQRFKRETRKRAKIKTYLQTRLIDHISLKETISIKIRAPRQSDLPRIPSFKGFEEQSKSELLLIIYINL